MFDIKKELPPVNNFQRIGFEMEGVGYVSMNWGKRRPDTEHADFYEAIKKTKLVRSESYDDFRGVYLSPEVAIDNIGYQHPAELISSPHLLSSKSLDKLRESFKKAMTSKDSKVNHLLKVQSAVLNDARHDTHESLNKENYTVSTRWNQVYCKPGRNLQTTVGIAAAMLLSDDLSTRNKVVNMLIFDTRKQVRVKELLKASICIQRVLVKSKYAIFDQSADINTYYMRLRLSIFMYLLYAYMPVLYAKNPLGYKKDIYGANFKGYSSFHGCGVPCRVSLREHLSKNPGLQRIIVKDIFDSMSESEIALWIIQGCTEPHGVFDLCCVGEEGFSIVTAVSKRFSIPNFYYSNRLYTVVECREGDAPLNQLMAQFLKGDISANGFIEVLKANCIYKE